MVRPLNSSSPIRGQQFLFVTSQQRKAPEVSPVRLQQHHVEALDRALPLKFLVVRLALFKPSAALASRPRTRLSPADETPLQRWSAAIIVFVTAP